MIGEAMVELSDVDFARSSAKVGCAGDTLNTAVYLARALAGGAWSSDYMTVLGEDPLSAEIARFIAAEGIGTNAIGRTTDRGPAVYAIHVDEFGERTFTYWRAHSAARLLFQTDRPTLDDLAAYRIIYLSGITLAILPRNVRLALIETCKSLKSQGHMIVFDSNYRPTLWPSEDEARRDIAKMWEATTVALPSHDDEALLYPDETPESALSRISAHGVVEIALKRGPRGPLLWIDGNVIDGDYAPAERVIDTTAAGDSFNATYLAARLKGIDPPDAALAGHRFAMRVIGSKGAILPKTP